MEESHAALRVAEDLPALAGTSGSGEIRLRIRAVADRYLQAAGFLFDRAELVAFLAALHAIRGAGRKLPVNLVLVAEGEEEDGSPHFGDAVRKPEVQKALATAQGIVMPSASQNLDGKCDPNDVPPG